MEARPRPRAGSVLSCSEGTWAPDELGGFLFDAPHSFAYSWTRNGTLISGAASSTISARRGGEYACRVTATNEAGSASQTSPAHAVLSAAKITKAKISSTHHRAKFSFKASGASGFRCALVKLKKHHKKLKPSFSSCHSPKTYKHLKPGKYTFEVRAVSAAGRGTPASRTFKIA